MGIHVDAIMTPTVIAITAVAVSVARGLVLLGRSGDVTIFLFSVMIKIGIIFMSTHVVIDMALSMAPLPP